MRKTTTSRLLVAMTLLVGLLSIGPRPAGAAVVKIPLIQFNIAGGNSTATQIYNTRNITAYAVNGNNPYFASLNEVCASDFNYFGGVLQNVYLRMVVTKPVEADCNWGSFGNVIMSAGAYMTGYADWLTNPNLNCGASNVECRAMICSKTNTYLGQMSGCSSHLVNGNSWLAGYQANEYRNKAISWAPYSLRYLLGDFNIERSDPNWPSNYNSYDKLGYVGLTWSTRTSRTKQIDYIYYVKGNVTFGDRASSCTSNSDHCLIQTSVWVVV